MTPACSIQQEENPNAKPVPYLHSHPYFMTPPQYQRFLGTLDFAFPRWETEFVLFHEEDGCIGSKALFATTHKIAGAIKMFLAMDNAEPQTITLPCHGEVR